jgi:serine/threonine protein kinase
MTGPDKAELLVGKLVADKYRIVRRLGGGGMGTVYVAVQEPLGREVAFKVIRREMQTDERSIERFQREALALSKVQHPHIVVLHDFGALPTGSLYFAMELVKGENLRQRLQRVGALSIKAGIDVVRAACGALAAAHAIGIIHRDLKPENILLMDAPGAPDFVKLVDFGVAKLTGSDALAEGEQLTAQGSVVGTPGYIAPEVAIRGVTTDPRSDLYALGVVWYECLAGRRPFLASTPTALLMAHALQPVPPLPSDVPLPVAGLVQRLLAKSPDDRPSSAQELARLIEALPSDGGTAPRSLVAEVTAGAPTVDDNSRVAPVADAERARAALDAAEMPTELTPRRAEQQLAALREEQQEPQQQQQQQQPQPQPQPVRGSIVVAVAIGGVLALGLGVLGFGVAFRPQRAAADAGQAAVSTTVEDAGIAAVDAGPAPTTTPDGGTRRKPPKKPADAVPDEHQPDIY